MNNTRNRLARIIMAAALTSASAVYANIPLDYYSSLNGLTGEALKTAAHKLLTSGVQMLAYGSGYGHTWDGFYDTDRGDDNSVIDRYSNDVRYFGDRGYSVSGMNIEHSFPKSWWGGTENNAYKDLFNLMPCEAKINETKSNYPMGPVIEINNAGNGCTSVGSGADGRKYWEPANKWKGDFARAYMYMATAYQDFSWTSQGVYILQDGDYPTLSSWASKTYIAWALADDVDNIEIKRNERVRNRQGNRNPFVDFPNMMRYIWGDSIGEPFNIYTTRKAGSPNPNNPNPGNNEPATLYSATFLDGDGGCTTQTVSNPDGLGSIWRLDTRYGWVAKAATGSGSDVVRHVSESYLYLPEIDLTDAGEVTFIFSHAVNFCASPRDYLKVTVDADGYTTDISDRIQWPAGNNWNFVPSGDVDLSDFAGSTIRIAFRYRSDASYAAQWEVQNVKVIATPRLYEDPADVEEKVLYESTFLGDDGGCKVLHEVRPEIINSVWKNTAQYGWKAQASWSDNGNITNYPSDAYLLTPTFTIAKGRNATLYFEHACKFAAKPANVLEVVVVDAKGNYHALPVGTWPTGTNWNFVPSGKVDLSQFAGQTIGIGFHYTSTSSEACTWEVKNVQVIQEAAADAELVADDSQQPAEYYSIDGRRVNPAIYRGIAIRRQGTSATKILLR